MLSLPFAKSEESIVIFLNLLIYYLLVKFVEIRHLFFLIIPLAIMAAKTSKKYNLKYAPLLLLLLWPLRIPSHIYILPDSGFLSFCSEIKENETVLASFYHYFPVFSKGDGEFAPKFDEKQAIIYGASYYVTKNKVNSPYLEFYKSFEVENPTYKGRYLVYRINLTKILRVYNLTLYGRLRVVNDRGEPIWRATCYVVGNNWKIPQISDKSGEILLIGPKGSKPVAVICRALGYEENSVQLPARRLVLKYLGLVHHYQGMRF